MSTGCPTEPSTVVESPLIFLSYTTADRSRVVAYHDYLKKAGYNVWMDIRQIKGGQDWKFEIEKALNRAALVIIFISKNSVDKRGVVQREIRDALDKSKEILEENIYIIPVLLDNVTLPQELARLQYLNEANGDCEVKIKESIDLQLAKLDRGIAQAQEDSSIRWYKVVKKEQWEGLPGYDTRYEILQFSSDEYPNISEIGDLVKGEVTKLVMRQRDAMLEQTPDFRNFGQVKFWRTNTLDIAFDQPSIVGRVVSLQCEIYRMNGGAAHPYSYPRTFSFLLHPLFFIESLGDIFSDQEAGFEFLQNRARSDLLSPREKDYAELDQEWVERGTSDWNDFKSFVFKRDGIALLFAPYHVGCYASGPQSCFVPFLEIVDRIKPVFKSALEIEYIKNIPPPLTIHQPD